MKLPLLTQKRRINRRHKPFRSSPVQQCRDGRIAVLAKAHREFIDVKINMRFGHFRR